MAFRNNKIYIIPLAEFYKLQVIKQIQAITIADKVLFGEKNELTAFVYHLQKYIIDKQYTHVFVANVK